MNAVSHILTECPACRSSFRVSAEHVGRTAKCTSCDNKFVVKPRAEQPGPTNAGLTPAATKPETIGVNCRLCGTRMYGTLDQVGQLLSCPDCSTKTMLPAPQRRKGPNLPAALEGEQYALWEGDEQPWGEQLRATQAPLAPVHCELCNTLQHVPLDKVGKEVTCPDCGLSTRVPRPGAKAERGPKRVERRSDTERSEIEVDELHASVLPASAPPLYSRLQSFDSQSQEEQERQISRVATNRRARPKMPRMPLLTGWKAFAFGPGVIARWLVLSGLIVVPIVFAAIGLTLLTSGFGAIAGVSLLCSAGTAFALWFAGTCAYCVTIVTESSEGNDTVQQWPSINPVDWLGETTYLIIACSASAIPGWAVGQAAMLPPPYSVLPMALSVWLFFPIVHLSTLDASTPWALITPNIASSFSDYLGTWTRFYFLSAIGFAAVAACLLAVATLGPAAIVVATPVLVGAVLAYFRLVGRLAWRLRDDS